MSVSFQTLNFNTEYELKAEQVAQHEIQADGTSKLDIYKDSIFSVTHHTGTLVWEGDRRHFTEQSWSVIRLKRGEALSLNTPTVMTCDQAALLEIQANGRSSRADLQAYRFKFEYLGDLKYKITMKEK